MSNTEQSLSLLLPSLSHRLPPELTALSNSLLAQSRHHAGNLKPEEEIARPYACSEIACKRSGAKLGLPTTVSRPPCAPRVYKKLLAFLERSLPTTLPAKPPGQHATPSKTRRPDAKDVGSPVQAGGTSGNSTPQGRQQRRRRQQSPSLESPTPKRRTAAFAGRVLGQRQRPADETTNDDGAPPWAMPMIRRLCRSFSVPSLSPHVYTGLCVVLKLADDRLDEPDHGDQDEEALEMKEQKKKQKKRKDTTGLTTALFFTVRSRMQRAKLSSADYLADCKTACAVVNADDAGHPAHDPDAMISKDDIEDWIKTISANRWAAGRDWWATVPENVIEPPDLEGERNEDDDSDEVHHDEDEDEDEDDLLPSTTTNLPARKRTRTKAKAKASSSTSPRHEPDHISDGPPSPLLPGLATMMQESVDYLSADRRADYKDWLAGIEKKLERMTSASASASALGGTRRNKTKTTTTTTTAGRGVGKRRRR